MSNRNAGVSRGKAGHPADIIAGLLASGSEANNQHSSVDIAESLEYIHSLSYEMSRIARHHDQRLLGYLLMLAAEEARCARARLNDMTH